MDPFWMVRKRSGLRRDTRQAPARLGRSVVVSARKAHPRIDRRQRLDSESPLPLSPDAAGSVGVHELVPDLGTAAGASSSSLMATIPRSGSSGPPSSSRTRPRTRAPSRPRGPGRPPVVTVDEHDAVLDHRRTRPPASRRSAVEPRTSGGRTSTSSGMPCGRPRSALSASAMVCDARAELLDVVRAEPPFPEGPGALPAAEALDARHAPVVASARRFTYTTPPGSCQKTLPLGLVAAEDPGCQADSVSLASTRPSSESTWPTTRNGTNSSSRKRRWSSGRPVTTVGVGK